MAKSIIEAMKKALGKNMPKNEPIHLGIKKEDGVRDMRQEAMDQGSHGAHELFGKDQS